MALYEVTTLGQEAKRLIEAESAAQAIRRCAEGQYTTRTVTKPGDIAALMSGGVALEKMDDPLPPAVDQPDSPELEYLRYFHREADFGPADDDVRQIINAGFVKTTGKELPEGYAPEEAEA